MALFESSRGNFIPFFIDEFKTNNATISFILSLNTIGCVIGSFAGGHLCEKFGHKFVFISGSVISTAAIFMSPFISNIYLLGIFYFIFGIGRSSLSVSVDSLVPVLSIGFEVILMNITHFMYGLGSFAGQSMYGELLYRGMSWRSIYLYVGIFFILSVIFTFFMKIPNMRIVQEHQAVHRKELYRNPLIFLFVLAVTFQLMTEAVVNTWFINYVRSSYGFNPADAAIYASIFFLMFAIGRLAGGFIVNKLGDARGLKIFLLSGATCIFIGLIFKRNGLILISISGFFVSIGFPTLMVLVNKAFKQNTSFAIGLITTFGNIFFVLLFNLSGILNDLIGTYMAFFMAPAALVSSFLTITLITKKSNINETI